MSYNSICESNESNNHDELFLKIISDNNNNLPFFKASEIVENSCSEKLDFTIIGELISDVENGLEFKINATFPENIYSKCKIVLKNENQKQA